MKRMFVVGWVTWCDVVMSNVVSLASVFCLYLLVVV
jgi:hypothetical protein